MDSFLQAAIAEAQKGLAEGGIPIGSVLVLDGRIIGRGHNQRLQAQSPVLHAEIDCLNNAGRRKAAEYRRMTLYSTLSPCDMCSGAILLYKIPIVIAGENRTFQGPEEYLRSRGVVVGYFQFQPLDPLKHLCNTEGVCEKRRARRKPSRSEPAMCNRT